MEVGRIPGVKYAPVTITRTWDKDFGIKLKQARGPKGSRFRGRNRVNCDSLGIPRAWLGGMAFNHCGDSVFRNCVQ